MRKVFVAAMAALIAITTGSVRAQFGAPDVDARISKLIASVSESRMEQLLRTLVGFGTRNTLSDAASTTRGVGAARQWILDEMKRSSPKLQVSFDTHQIPKGAYQRITRDVELRNIVAVLPGRTPRRIYVSGHYDTINLGAQGQAGLNTGAGFNIAENADAPGADDDGSGTVLVMELARAFAESGIDFDATFVFTAVAGEEYGLVGAREEARAAKAAKVPVQAIFNNDIVGGSTGGDGIVDGATIRLYSEGPEDSPSRSLAIFTQRVAARYVPSHRIRLMALRDRFNRGGDHTAWNLEGFAAVGFRESRENYSKQHNANDTIEGVSFAYLGQNARVNAAAMAVLALAPPPPAVTTDRGAPRLDRRPSGYDAHLQWTASPGAAGYRIFWREAWAPDWQREMFVGNVTEYTLPHVNVDDWVFGVAAVDSDGHESTVSAYVPAPANY